MFCRKHRGGNPWGGNLPPTPGVICEMTQPDLLGGPIPHAHVHHIPGTSQPTRYTSTDDHSCTHGASPTPDILPAHPSFLATPSGRCNLLAVPSLSPGCTEEPSPCPQPPPSPSLLRGKHDGKEQTASFSLQDKRLSPRRLAAISTLKKIKLKEKKFKRTKRIGLSAAERVQVHYPS